MQSVNAGSKGAEGAGRTNTLTKAAQKANAIVKRKHELVVELARPLVVLSFRVYTRIKKEKMQTKKNKINTNEMEEEKSAKRRADLEKQVFSRCGTRCRRSMPLQFSLLIYLS